MEELLEAFRIESAEMLEAMESSILALERGESGAMESLFRAAHTLKGSAGIVGLRRLERYAHDFETRLGRIRSEGAITGGDAFGALLACRDRCSAILRGPADDTPGPEDEDSLRRLDEALSPGSSAPAKAELAAGAGRRGAEGAPRTVRVSDAKLDELLNLAGELVTVQAHLSRMAEESIDRGFTGVAESMRGLVSRLRSAAMEMRLVRVDGLFSRYDRLTRDVSKELGKEVRLITEGGDTELDKNAVESLVDPLLHLLRNAVDHGIETPDERTAAGKPRAGRVRLSARHDGGSVVIEVSDDGRGVDWDRVRMRAAERGSVPETREELEELLFAPGFSTSEAVSSVSGRGVGLDVVKTAIESLGGEVSVSSRRGSGTEFSLRVPLTIAIIDGFLAVAGRTSFILPLTAIGECFERPRKRERDRLIERNGELIPLLDIRERFSTGPASVDDGTEAILVLTTRGGKLALAFDRLVGGYQTVVKPLGEITRYARGVAGATIIADGSVALILDPPALAKSLRDE